MGAIIVAAVQDASRLQPLHVIGSFLTAGIASTAGILLWRGLPRGRLLSLIIQGVQIFGINTLTQTYRVELGAGVNLAFITVGSKTYLGFDADIRGFFAIWTWSGQAANVLTINLLALVAFIYLWRRRFVSRRPASTRK
jgi:hypothetical protein